MVILTTVIKNIKIKHFINIILIIICFFLVYGEIDAVNWYEVLIETIFYSPIPIVLFFLSNSARKQDLGWLKKLDLVGMYASSVTIAILLFVLIRELVRYYFA